MRSNFFKVIFFFLFFPSLSFCQSWPSYSDSVYTLIKKNDWKSAYQLTYKVDSLLSVEGYSNWLEQGMSKREALRQAQLYMLNTDKYKSPFYWGAFVLIEK